MLSSLSRKYRDLLARAGWTAAQAALGLVTVEVLDVPVGWAPIVAVALSSLKSYVATKVGNPETVTFDLGHEPLGVKPPTTPPPSSRTTPRR